MTVLSLLAGLLLPAVQAARAAAREVQCRHNLHEFGDVLAIYSQRLVGSTHEYEKNETGLASVDNPVAFYSRKVHDDAVLALLVIG
jgi:hypothetical protein